MITDAHAQNALDESGALRLVRAIKAWWAERGQHPNVWLERMTSTGLRDRDGNIVVIRSDMKNGMPQG